MARYLVLVLLALALAACGGPSAPTPDAAATRIAQAVAATLQAAPTATPSPTPTDTPSPTLTFTPTNTPSPTPSPTKTPTPSPAPTKTPTPTFTPSLTPSVTPTPTRRPEDQALITYLKAFAPLANEIWSKFPGESEVDSQQYVDQLQPLDDRLQAMTVPKAAEQMHAAFSLVSINVLQWHHYRAGALLFPDQFAEYMNLASQSGDEAMAAYYDGYLPAREALLSRLGLSAESVGFVD